MKEELILGIESNRRDLDISLLDMQELGRIHREQEKHPVIIILGPNVTRTPIPIDSLRGVGIVMVGAYRVETPQDIPVHVLKRFELNDMHMSNFNPYPEEEPKGKFYGPPAKHVSRRRQLKSSK